MLCQKLPIFRKNRFKTNKNCQIIHIYLSKRSGEIATAETNIFVSLTIVDFENKELKKKIAGLSTLRL